MYLNMIYELLTGKVAPDGLVEIFMLHDEGDACVALDGGHYFYQSKHFDVFSEIAKYQKIKELLDLTNLKDPNELIFVKVDFCGLIQQINPQLKWKVEDFYDYNDLEKELLKYPSSVLQFFIEDYAQIISFKDV